MEKEKMIEEMAKDINYAITKECKLNTVGHCNGCEFNVPENDGIHCQTRMVSKILSQLNYSKIPEGAVVLTEGEYGDLLYDEVATIERDIAEYWATSDFDSVVKELHKNGYRKLDDHAVMVLRKAKGLEERIRKETAREFAEKIQDYLNDKVCEEFGDNACDVTYFTIDVDRVISDVFELAKHFGVEVEE